MKMIRILLFALLPFALLMLSACDETHSTPETTDPTLSSSIPITEPTVPETSENLTEPVVNSGNLLFEPAIETLERIFAYSSEFPLPVNWYSMGLLQEYSSPEDVSTYPIFQYGTRTSVQEWELTEEERSYLSQFEHFNGVAEAKLRVYRIPKEKVFEIMNQYFGLEPDEIPAVDSPRMVYWEQTDCYYIAEHGFLGEVEIEILYAERLVDGTIRFVYYRPGPEYWGEAVIESFVGGFRFVSNRHYETLPDGF